MISAAVERRFQAADACVSRDSRIDRLNRSTPPEFES